MASIFKKPRSPFWFAAYRDAQGQRRQKTTKTKDRGKAIDMARMLERLAASGRGRTLTEAVARKAVSELVEQATGEAVQFHTCRTWLDEWLAGKRGAVADKSIEKYEQVVHDFLSHLGDRADLTLAAIGPKDVRGFRDALAKGARSPDTVNQSIRKVLTAPFLAAVRLGYISANPCAAVERLRDDGDREREVFTPEQVAGLIEAADDEWRGVILCGYFTGLRLRDVVNLKWEAVDFDKSLLRVRTEKTGATIMLPLHSELAAWLRAQTRGIGKAPIFRGLAGMGTGGRLGLSGRFKTIMERAKVKGRILRGADGKGRKTTSLSFHSLRHSFVSALANAGVARELRQKLSGHADERSHARYTHHEIEALRAAVAKLPGLAVAG